WQTVAQVVPLAINVFMTPYVIHGLGPQRFSIFLLIATVANLLAQFDAGIGASTLRFCTLYAGRDDRISTTRLLMTVSVVIIGITVVVSAVVVVATPLILGFFGVDAAFIGEAAVLLRVLTVLIGLIMLRGLFHSVLAARYRFRWMSITMLLGYVVYAVGLGLAATHHWDLRSLALTMVTQQLVTSLLTIPAGLRYLDHRGLRFMPRAEASVFWSYAWRVQLTGLISIAVSQKDQLVAGRLLTAQASGPYSQGYGLAFQLKSLPYNAGKPIQALIGDLVGKEGPDAARARVAQLQRVWVRAITGWAVVGIPAVYVGVRAWLPDSFSLTGAVVVVLFTGHVFTLLTTVTSLWAMTLGFAGMDLRATSAGFVVNLLLSVLLGAWLGMFGVIVATAIGQAVAMAYLTWDTGRRLPTPLPAAVGDIPWVAVLVAGALAGALEWVVAPHLPRGVLGLLGAGLAALPAVACFLLLAFRGRVHGLLVGWRRR
ncbi:MAG TPA: polysaccharide biosynthesis C-terminal domain-containing protein, partial [Dermatophilaceae bacterium]|nr:polysaccharide biosynthesis C-terminal domain-containing protein [Dermatophilaceae bacterium]